MRSFENLQSKPHEDEPRAYATDSHEVARCIIEFEGRVEPGCTFRFVGRSMRRGAMDEVKKLKTRL